MSLSGESSAVEHNIGIFGTFDVENYGDLLLPLIAEAELKRRLGRVTMTRYSYAGRAAPEWPYDVTSLSELPDAAARLDGVLLGGGHVIRFDKDVAPGYEPPSDAIHHPTGYWLTPALVAMAHGIPIAWNAPGVVGPIPAWADQTMRLVLAASHYVSVRDEPARRLLERVGGVTRIAVVPDTAFGVASLLSSEPPSPGFVRAREAARLAGPYLVVQAQRDVKSFVNLVRRDGLLRDYRLLVVPIGPALGDDAAIFDDEGGPVVRLRTWPDPLLLAELISRSEGVVGGSLHLGITALAFGVPVFRPAHASGGKYEILSAFETVFPFDVAAGTTADWFSQRIGRKAPETAVTSSLPLLNDHWDRIASLFSAGRKPSKALDALSLFWQELPGILEASALREADSAENLLARERQIAEMSDQLSRARREIETRQERITALEESTSWRMTAPFRRMKEGFRRRPTREGGRIIDIERIERQTLASEPFEWTTIGDLFRKEDAASLADSFPRDHFKTVAGYDGEKGFEYEARSLIDMGAAVPTNRESLSPSWRRLAEDLLSPAYRSAMARLTRLDIAGAPVEVNVFHYGPSAWLGPHVDLQDKLATHILYFNREWDREDGGCLTILKSARDTDIAFVVEPRVGNSAVVVRSDRSWHAVSRVAAGCRESRRSVTVTFYRAGSVSTMWPPGDTTPLHDYDDPAPRAASPPAKAHRRG